MGENISDEKALEFLKIGSLKIKKILEECTEILYSAVRNDQKEIFYMMYPKIIELKEKDAQIDLFMFAIKNSEEGAIKFIKEHVSSLS